MNIVKFNKNSQDKLINFQDTNKFARIRLLDSDLDNTGRTVYLEQNNQILGIATIYHNAFHPNFENLRFAVDTRNEILFTRLYEALLNSDSVSSLRLSIHVNETDAKNLEAFLARNNFSLILKTECPQIDLERSIENLSKYNLPVGYRLEKYSDLNETETKMLRDFRLNGYVETHFWSPPLSIESPYWQETDLDTDDKNISWVVFKDKSIVLCSDAHIEDNCVYMGWGWHDDTYENLTELKSIWSTVLKQQLNHCKMFEKTFVGEFDSLDKYGQYKSSLLIHLTQENYYTYQKV